MKNLFILFLLLYELVIPSSAVASHIDLKPCVKVSHCVREELNVERIDSSFEKVKSIVENTPRTTIVESDGDYLHAEVTSRFMKYVDDLEISFFPEKNNLIIRSESRVGDGDFGVNRKRVDLLINNLLDE
tara:strand:+ start:1153 stop:1542 length:390 start_codon:yes stop_codon:yes gene_type:complete